MVDDSYFTSFGADEFNDPNQSPKHQPFLGVRDFMDRNGFARYSDAFRKNNISSREDFMNLRFGSLAQLGVSSFTDQKRLMHLISREQRQVLREQQAEFARQKRAAAQELRPGTAPNLLGTARFGGLAADEDEEWSERRPQTAGINMNRTWSVPTLKPASPTKAWMARSMTMRVQPSLRRLEAPNMTTSKAEREVIEKRFMAVSMKSLKKMQLQNGDQKRERLSRLRTQKVDLKSHHRGATADVGEAGGGRGDSGPGGNQTGDKNQKTKKSGRGGAPSAKAMKEAKLAYKRHQLRVSLENLSVSMNARQARLDDFCVGMYERLPGVAQEAADLRRNHWKPPRRISSVIKKKGVRKAPLKLPPKSKVKITRHRLSKDGSGLNGVYLQLHEIKTAVENYKKPFDSNTAKAGVKGDSDLQKMGIHQFMDSYHSSFANFTPPPKTKPGSGTSPRKRSKGTLTTIYHQVCNQQLGGGG